MKKFLSLVLLLLSGILWSDSALLEKVMSANGIDENMAVINQVKGKSNEKLVTGIAYHNMAGDNLNLDYIEKAIELLEGEYIKNSDPLALGFWGSVITIRSSYEYNNNDVLKSLKSLEEGLKLIDKSVDIEPNSLDIRFLRLINGVEVAESSPLNRDEAINDDISYFDSKSDELSNDNLVQYLYYKSRFLILSEDIDGALYSLEKALTVAPGSTYAQLCEELLLEWEE